MTTNQLWTLRQQAADLGDCDLSRLCSAALWGTSAERAQALWTLKRRG